MTPLLLLPVICFILISSSNLAHASSPPSTAHHNGPIDVVIGVDGGTESIRACCFDARSGHILGKSHAVPYVTSHPHPGWAEQNPEDWYNNMIGAVRGALSSISSSSSSSSSYNIRAICADTTCCSVVALSRDYTPLRPCLLWMDARSANQAKQIMTVANEIASSTNTNILDAFPELRVNCNGEGPISAEWLLPKAMWIRQNEPEIYENAEIICEYQDYLNYRLTGKMVASGCNVASRWHHDGWDALEKNHGSDDNDENKGRPMKLYEALGMKDLAAKLPKKTLAMGDVIGTLSKEAARDLNLPKDTLVVQGGPDAFVGMIGLGTIRPGQLCLITGSSHLHCLITPTASSAPGTWGAYRGAPLAHLCFAEGGQSSTGSLVRWVKELLGGDDNISYKSLDDEAAKIPPGSEGLVALETWQGSRTPHTDPLARGAFAGLTLAHTRAHIFRSIMEAVCYGTRACFDALEAAASQSSDMPKVDEVVIAGGATRSPLWLQLHADITGRSFLLNENTDGPLLGCAILASVGAGIHPSVEDAAGAMIRRERTVRPDPSSRKVYDRLYNDLYLKLRPGVKPVFNALSELRGGDASDSGLRDDERHYIISPSLLAADWSDMKGEVQKCIDANVCHLHVDVFDGVYGVYLDSPHALTFGPQMVDAIRKRFANHSQLILDVHLCVDRPARYAKALSEAGATRLIFMFEATVSLDEAVEFATEIRSLGMKCGVSINPKTPISEVYPLLETGLVDLVDILAVEPGFGGQAFNPISEQKITDLRRWRSERDIDVKILVDGGINSETVKRVVEAGAEILVAGTAIFRHRDGFSAALKDLTQ